MHPERHVPSTLLIALNVIQTAPGKVYTLTK